MKKLKSIHADSEIRQQEIIEAALSCFTEKGYTETGIADICRKAKASTGSLYHHFKSKTQLAAAVYLSGIKDYQTGMIEALTKQTTAKDGIFRVVSYHLTWVAEHPEWARFLFQQRYSEFMDETEAEMNRMNADFFSKMAIWFWNHIEKGHLKTLPRDIFISLLMGPCQEFVRLYLSGMQVTAIDRAADEIAKGAWAAMGISDGSVQK